MRKIDFNGNEEIGNNYTLDNLDSLKEFLRELDVHAEVEHRVKNQYIIKSMDNVGGSQYLSNGFQDIKKLEAIAEKTERKGASTWYYVRLNGQKVSA